MEALADDVVRIGELELRFRINAPGATVFEFLVPPNARVPAPHHHAEADELLFGLDGVLDVTVAGETTGLGPGQVIFIPRGIVHHHRNPHDVPARVLTSITPGTITRRYFEELAAVVNVAGPPDAAAVREIMARHGLIGA